MNKLLTYKDIAALLGCSAKYVYNLRIDGGMPPTTPLPGSNKGVRWKESDIDLWITLDCDMLRYMDAVD